MSDHPKVAIFWDYENCSPPSNSSGLGYNIVNNISRIARLFGSVTTFRAYLDISAQSSKSVLLRSELQSSGVSIIDCPHNGRKDVVDKMVLVDMLAFAVDHPTPATIILITGDRDYAYAVSTLRLRKYQIILVVPSSPHTSPSLESQASLVLDWGAAVLRIRTDTVNTTQPVRQPCFDLDANLVTKLLGDLQDPSLDNSDVTMHPYPTTSQGTPGLRRISTRDLLEPSRLYRDTGCHGSTQEYTHTSTSPRKSTSTRSDSTPGGLSIPKTPLRSRHTSVSTGSTQARSSTMVVQTPAVGQDTPAKNPQPPHVRRSSPSDSTDIIGSAMRSTYVPPLLDTLELPLHDSCPPSSIVVRSPLQGGQLMPFSEKTTVPSSSCLASPFIMSKPSTELRPIPSFCTGQSHRPMSPIVAPTKTLPETVASTFETTQTRGIGVPKETESVADPHIVDDDANFRRSASQQERAWDGTDTPKSNYHSYYFAPPTTYSPSSRNVEVHLDSRHVSPAAGPPGIGNSVFTALPRASGIPSCSASGLDSVLSSSSFSSVLFTSAESHEHDDRRRHETWTKFKPLIHLLLAAHKRGITRPSRSTIALDLVQSDKRVYERAGASRFRDYTALAEQAGIIELGGREGGAWVALHPNWFQMDGATTNFLSSRVPSPTANPPKVIQNPFLTDCKTPLIGGTAIFQSPTFTSPEFKSSENSDQQDGASRATIPAQFQPLIDVLVRMRAEGFHQTLRSVVGQQLSQDVYARAKVSGFKEYVHQASEAQLVQFGGVGGHAWIDLHPELRI